MLMGCVEKLNYEIELTFAPNVRLNLTGIVKSLGGKGVGVRGGSKAFSLAAEMRERGFRDCPKNTKFS